MTDTNSAEQKNDNGEETFALNSYDNQVTKAELEKALGRGN